MTEFAIVATTNQRRRRKRRARLRCRCTKWRSNLFRPCWHTRAETAPERPRYWASAVKGCEPNSSDFKFLPPRIPFCRLKAPPDFRQHYRGRKRHAYWTFIACQTGHRTLFDDSEAQELGAPLIAFSLRRV